MPVYRFRWPARQRERNLFVLGLTQFLAQLSFFIVLPLFPLYVRELGAGSADRVALWAGLAIGVTPMFGALTTPWWARRAAREGYRRAIEQILVGVSLLTLLIALAGAPWQLVLLRAAIGALGAFSALAIAAALVASEREQATRAVARLLSLHSAAMVVGPLLGGMLADHAGARVAIGLAATCYVAAFVAFRAGYRDVPGPAPEPAAARALAGPGWLGPLALALFAMQFADSSLGPVLPGFLLTLAAPDAWLGSLTGLTFSAGALAAAVGARFVGQRIPRSHLERLLPWALVGGALSWAGIALGGVWWQVPAGRATAGLASGALVTMIYGVAAQRAGGPALAALVARLSAATALGAALGPVVSGAALGGAARTAFAFDALLMVAAAAIVWWANGALHRWWCVLVRALRRLAAGIARV